MGWFSKKEPEEKSPELILAEKMIRLKEVEQEIIDCTKERETLKAFQRSLTEEFEALKKELGGK
jgi:hypothetical protein